MKTLRVGIASYEQMKARTLAIARGEYKPAAGEPKVWFRSAESFARVLSDRNRALLGIESLPDAEDDGAIRLRPAEPRRSGLGSPASSVSADLIDAAIAETGREGTEAA